jgi:hypothetical protein
MDQFEMPLLGEGGESQVKPLGEQGGGWEEVMFSKSWSEFGQPSER